MQNGIIVGNGFDLSNYKFNNYNKGPIGWAGRISPEKGLEDAAFAAAAMGEKLFVWGINENASYSKYVEESVPSGTIEWRGFLPTEEMQLELGNCRAFLNTPKWNEAYGNVVVEALACGVPVVAYKRGGPCELITHGETGFLVPPDDVNSLILALRNCDQIDRRMCRNWVKNNASYRVFSERVEDWIHEGLNLNEPLETLN